ncbi:hypothetical protein ACRS43_08975 [Enterobacter cloacae]
MTSTRSSRLKQAFIDGFGEVGLHAGTVHCFSAKPTTIKEYLSVIFERGQAYAPLVLKVLGMLQRKYSIKIEIAADRKFFDLEGVSTEDALKLIEAASAIRVSHSEDIEISDTDCPLPVPLNKTEGLPQHVTPF